MSLNGDFNVIRNGRSTSQVSIYNYPEYLNPFYEDDNHKRLRFWKLSKKGNGKGTRNSFSIENLRDIWSFKSFSTKKKSSSLGINKTSESPPVLRRNLDPDTYVQSGFLNSQDRRDRYSGTASAYGSPSLSNDFDRRQPHRSSLQHIAPNGLDSRRGIGFNRNDQYRSTTQYTGYPTPQARQCVRSSQTSLASTNPFESDNESVDYQASPQKAYRKKRKAPLPPKRESSNNTSQSLHINESTTQCADIKALSDEITQFVNTTHESSTSPKPTRKNPIDMKLNNKLIQDNSVHIDENIPSSSRLLQPDSKPVTETESVTSAAQTSQVQPSTKDNITVKTLIIVEADNTVPTVHRNTVNYSSRDILENGRANGLEKNGEKLGESVKCTNASHKPMELVPIVVREKSKESTKLTPMAIRENNRKSAELAVMEKNNQSTELASMAVREKSNNTEQLAPMAEVENNNNKSTVLTHKSVTEKSNNFTELAPMVTTQSFEIDKNILLPVEKNSVNIQRTNEAANEAVHTHVSFSSDEPISKPIRSHQMSGGKPKVPEKQKSYYTLAEPPKCSYELNNNRFPKEKEQAVQHNSSPRVANDEKLNELHPIVQLRESSQDQSVRQRFEDTMHTIKPIDWNQIHNSHSTEENSQNAKRKSVKDIIESINRSQRLLNESAAKGTKVYSTSLYAEENELNSAKTKSTPAQQLNNFSHGGAHVSENAANSGNSFQKSTINKTVCDHRESSPTAANLDWNPVPKPKRTNNGVTM